MEVVILMSSIRGSTDIIIIMKLFIKYHHLDRTVFEGGFFFSFFFFFLFFCLIFVVEFK